MFYKQPVCLDVGTWAKVELAGMGFLFVVLLLLSLERTWANFVSTIEAKRLSRGFDSNHECTK